MVEKLERKFCSKTEKTKRSSFFLNAKIFFPCIIATRPYFDRLFATADVWAQSEINLRSIISYFFFLQFSFRLFFISFFSYFLWRYAEYLFVFEESMKFKTRISNRWGESFRIQHPIHCGSSNLFWKHWILKFQLEKINWIFFSLWIEYYHQFGMIQFDSM